MRTDKELRAVVFGIAGNRCEWPQCGEPARELAHIHSKGMGGRDSARTVGNAFAACRDHARISDGLNPDGGNGNGRFYEEWEKVTGIDETDPAVFVKMFVRLEALREFIEQERGVAA